MEYDDDMRGVLFHAKEKKSESSPDYTGEVQISGVTLRLAGWAKTAKSGKKYLSLAVSYNRDSTDRLARVAADMPQDGDDGMVTIPAPVDDADLPF